MSSERANTVSPGVTTTHAPAVASRKNWFASIDGILGLRYHRRGALTPSPRLLEF
jgi:hypothetical protein